MHSPAVREQALALVASGLNDCEVARRTGISRTTIRDWRRPRYVPRTRSWHLRIFLDSTYPAIVTDAESLLKRCLPGNRVGRLYAHEGRMTIISTYSQHFPCLFPQHGPGKKHERPIVLEPWHQQALDAAPWQFLRGCIRSDGCSYINRTGPYEYLSYEFANRSQDILDLFGRTCTTVGVEYRRYARAIRVYRRESVALLEANVGVKR